MRRLETRPNYIPAWASPIRQSFNSVDDAERSLILAGADQSERVKLREDLKIKLLGLMKTVQDISGRKMSGFIDCSRAPDGIWDQMPDTCKINPLYFIPSEGRMVTAPTVRRGIFRRSQPDFSVARNVKDEEWTGDYLVIAYLTQGILNVLPRQVQDYVRNIKLSKPSIVEMVKNKRLATATS